MGLKIANDTHILRRSVNAARKSWSKVVDGDGTIIHTVSSSVLSIKDQLKQKIILDRRIPLINISSETRPQLQSYFYKQCKNIAQYV